MTPDLQALIREAGMQLGSDACAAGRHRWESIGGRRCPNDYTDTCGQAVYRCVQCGAWDHGEPGGPGAVDCEQTCEGEAYWNSFNKANELPVLLSDLPSNNGIDPSPAQVAPESN